MLLFRGSLVTNGMPTNSDPRTFAWDFKAILASDLGERVIGKALTEPLSSGNAHRSAVASQNKSTQDKILALVVVGNG